MHWRLENIRNESLRWSHRTFSRKNIEVRKSDRFVSFTFDDFPESAVRFGVPILEEYNIKGTFYAAGALADASENQIPCFRTESISSLLDRGHEVGCHTFGHEPISHLKSHSLIRQLDDNQAWLNRVVAKYRMRSFSYPLGQVSVSSKRTIGSRFDTARGTESGINLGRVDSNLLRANKIYDWLENMSSLSALIDKAALSGGWVIFYTHDIDDNPSKYGCTPTLFRSVVQCAVASGLEILPVREAYCRIINAG